MSGRWSARCGVAIVVCLASCVAAVGMASAADGDDEKAKIEWLIARVEGLKGAKFIRNGTEHDAAEAAAHLRRKWRAAGDKVRTADDFIEQLASRSSVSGKPYRIRFADGTETDSGDWLRAELAERKAGR